MIELFKVFFTAEKTKPWLVLLCLFIGVSLEAIGIGSLIPIANAILGDTEQSASPINAVIISSIEWFGFKPSFGALLMLSAVIMTIRSIFLFLAMFYSGVAVANVMTQLRRKMIRSTFEASWSFYSSQRSGDIAATLASDAQRAGDSYNLAALALGYGAQALSYTALAFFVNWRIALSGIFCAGLIFVSSMWVMRLSKRTGRKALDRTAVLSTELVDLFRNLKSLKAMGRFKPLLGSMSQQLKKLKSNIVTMYAARYGLSYGTDILVTLTVVGGAYAAHQYAKLGLAELAVMGLVFFQILSYVAKFQKFTQNALILFGGHQRIAEFIEKASNAKEPQFGSKQPLLKNSCEFNSVSFMYDGVAVIKDVNLSIPEKQITVLQGPSGSGKTTIIDLLTGLQRTQTGQIKIGADRIEDLDIAKWRNKIGYVSQDLLLFHDTIRENLVLGDDTITEDEVQQSLQQAHALEFIDALPNGIETNVGEQGARLSGGQRQRIALARALLKKPELLILDEVTSALDPETEAEIIQNIVALRKQYTIVAITHKPAWTDIADRLYTVSNGQVKLVSAKKKSKRHG